jgi:hypothetical protein
LILNEKVKQLHLNEEGIFDFEMNAKEHLMCDKRAIKRLILNEKVKQLHLN